jgi:hypothetical protein
LPETQQRVELSMADAIRAIAGCASQGSAASLSRADLEFPDCLASAVLNAGADRALHMTRGAKNGSVSGRLEPPEARLKLALMACIHEGIRERYRTLQEAARVSKINRELLSRVRHGEHRRCSIASLLGIAERLQIHIKINVRLVKHKNVAMSATKLPALNRKIFSDDFDRSGAS